MLKADWIKPKKDIGEVCPVFLKKFNLNSNVKNAKLIISARGVYTAELNGKRVGDFVLAPGWTQYDTRIQYQTYDVTKLLSDNNEIKITLADGWYKGRIKDNFLEEDYTGVERFERLQKDGVVSFEGSVEDVIPYIRNSQCTIHPSYYPEGMSNVCLESAACGRAVITTDRPGCRETIRDGISGYLIKEKDSQDLIDKIKKFLALSPDERKRMGESGREYMEEQFDRNLVIEKYLDAIREIA